MKRINSVISLFVMLTLCMTSCSKEDESQAEQKVTINPTSITMHYDETKQLSATNANSWNSDDNYIAEVDNKGLVKGGHIGTTIITAKNGNSFATCEVTITPKYDIYDTPILDWGATMSSIQSQETHPKSSSSSTSSMLAYNYTKYDTSCALFYFFEGGKMSRIVVYLDLLQYTNAGNHLLERYTPLSSDAKDNFLMFTDAYTKEKMKTVIGLQTTKVSGTELTMITYIPATNR